MRRRVARRYLAVVAAQRQREVADLEIEQRRRTVAAARHCFTARFQRGRLVGNLRAWERAERLRRFIAAFEQIGDRRPEAQTWLKWAYAQVQALDPLLEPEVVTDLSVELSDYFTGPGSWEKPVSDWWTTTRSLMGSLFNLCPNSRLLAETPICTVEQALVRRQRGSDSLQISLKLGIGAEKG